MLRPAPTPGAGAVGGFPIGSLLSPSPGAIGRPLAGLGAGESATGGAGDGAGIGGTEGAVGGRGAGVPKLPIGGGAIPLLPETVGAGAAGTSEPTGGGLIRTRGGRGGPCGPGATPGPGALGGGGLPAWGAFGRVKIRYTTSAPCRITRKHKMPQAVAEARPRSALRMDEGWAMAFAGGKR